MVNKQFDPELFKKNDKAAKDAARKIFKNLKDFELKLSESKFAVDFLVYKNGEHFCNLEVEIKRVWKDKEFKYDTVQFPERKRKFTVLEKPTLFLMFNDKLTSYLVVHGKYLVDSSLKEVHNKYVRAGELFFQVPISKVAFNDIKKALEGIK